MKMERKKEEGGIYIMQCKEQQGVKRSDGSERRREAKGRIEN